MEIPHFALSDTYLNPVYQRSFADPFILKFRGEYFAYCTGFAEDGRVFGVLSSPDLINWTKLPGAMEVLTSGPPFYWAPEVTYRDGTFYLYYSVGNEALMEIRVATSGRPDGAFIDSGAKLTGQDFAIDPHVFCDDDGTAYMFYATDFLEGSHIGTGTVVDRMLNPFVLAGHPRTVTRAKYDWQVYDPERKEKGGVRWHTVEGPFVLKRKGTYYEMFSGGNWQNTSYGVSVAVTHDIENDEEWNQQCDGSASLPLLRTVPGKVIGPGHNSVIFGPDNRELYCIYHRWVDGERVLAIDRMDYAGGDRIFLVGPTSTPQKAPFRPSNIDNYANVSENRRLIKGNWVAGNRSIVSNSIGKNEIVYETESESFLATVSLRSSSGGEGTYGIRLASDTDDSAQFFIDPSQNRVGWMTEGKTTYVPLPPDFDHAVWHEFRIEVDGRIAKAALDGNRVSIEELMRFETSAICVVAEGCAGAEFSAFTFTEGFEELFENADLGSRSWRVDGAERALRLEEKCLVLPAPSSRISLTKRVSPGDFALAINVRIEKDLDPDGSFSFGCGEIFSLQKSGPWHIVTRAGRWELPKSYSSETFHQFKLLGNSTSLELYLEDVFVGSHLRNRVEGNLEIIIENATAMLDMVRFTRLR